MGSGSRFVRAAVPGIGTAPYPGVATAAAAQLAIHVLTTVTVCSCLFEVASLRRSTLVIISTLPPCACHPPNKAASTALHALQHCMHTSPFCSTGPLSWSDGCTSLFPATFHHSCCMDAAPCFLAMSMAPLTRLVGLGLHDHVHIGLTLWYMAHTEL